MGIMGLDREQVLSKVPEVTFGFWVIKILATTLGETGGDSVTMSWLHADQNAHNGGLSHRSRHISHGIHRSSGRPNFGKAIQPLGLLDRNRRLHDSRYGAGGLFRPLIRHRLRRRLLYLARVCLMLARRLVLHPRLCERQQRLRNRKWRSSIG
jgi:hypothetical protein